MYVVILVNKLLIFDDEDKTMKKLFLDNWLAIGSLKVICIYKG